MRATDPITAIGKEIGLMGLVSRLTVDKREVDSLDAPRSKLRLEFALGGECPRKDEDTGGALIEPLDGAEIGIVAAVHPPKEHTCLIDERVPVTPLVREGQEIRRFIDDGEIAIGVKKTRAIELAHARARNVRPVVDRRIWCDSRR